MGDTEINKNKSENIFCFRNKKNKKKRLEEINIVSDLHNVAKKKIKPSIIIEKKLIFLSMNKSPKDKKNSAYISDIELIKTSFKDPEVTKHII